MTEARDDDLEKALFFELYESLDRQGPGDRASTARALACCSELPASPTIVDLGCGTGAQTLDLAELSPGTLLALDRHEPSVEKLQRRIEAAGLGDRVTALVGEMGATELAEESLDLVWSEGALYNLGLARGLATCKALLRQGGYLAFTEPVWRSADPPPKVRAAFEADYPGIGDLPAALAAIESSGFELIEHFPLPPEAWWEAFYAPMEKRIEALQAQYAGDPKRLAVLEELAEEPRAHREHGHTYGYEFFILRKTSGQGAG